MESLQGPLGPAPFAVVAIDGDDDIISESMIVHCLVGSLCRFAANRVEGRSILPMDVWGAIEDVPETSSGLFQIVRPRRVLERLTIRVGYAGEPELASLKERVADSVEAAVGLRPLIELVPNAVIMQSGSRHKIPRTVKQ